VQKVAVHNNSCFQVIQQDVMAVYSMMTFEELARVLVLGLLLVDDTKMVLVSVISMAVFVPAVVTLLDEERIPQTRVFRQGPF
jgi:hypothetical protein